MVRSQRGTVLIDAVLAILIMAAAGVVFSAAFPSGLNTLRDSSEQSKAAAMAQKKVEQVRSLDYANITYTNLLAAGYIDSTPTSSPYWFTSVDSVATDLNGATGTLTITPQSGAILKIVAAVQWRSERNVLRNVTVTTLVADSSPWVH